MFWQATRSAIAHYSVTEGNAHTHQFWAERQLPQSATGPGSDQAWVSHPILFSHPIHQHRNIMDSFINLAKQGIQAYESHSNVSKTGGHEYNSPSHGSAHATGRPDLDYDEVVGTASRNGSGDSSLFSSALSFIKQNQNEHERPVDEDEVVRSHKKAYEKNEASNMSASSLGSAAALQILKQFTSGSGSSSSGSGHGGSSAGGSSSQLISLAMAEASKLFDKSGGTASGNKQDAVNGAAMTVMKLLVQSKFSATTGGGDKGSLGGLMSLASKFI
ncbi:hypothetical protein BXZ70DRAFT_1009149 [Cristinia sonorae]|uniref:DUF7721 domain-containing protein n=1 Tax=Cristinia sonorae TaxID=1940300 RepID=A0A8K0ULY5_9AGAR|nr:hypothetical protein BXZ70DRAFT_1009149 [Cristinia sonorae]